MTITRSIMLSSAAIMAVAIASPAMAECSVTTGAGTGDAPETGDTVTCSAPLDNSGISGGADDVTVDILDESSAGLSTSGESGVTLGSGATVTVGAAGQVVTQGDQALGLNLDNNAAVTVNGTVSTSGEGSPAIRTGLNSTVDVAGTVRTGGGTSPAISVDGGSTVNVNMGGDVRTGNSGSDAILLLGDGTTLNVNSGALVTTSSGMSSPVRATGNNAVINVAGDVRSSSGNADAIRVEGNMGTVTVSDGGFVTAQSSNSDAIDMAGTGGTVTVEEGGEVRISSGNSAAIRGGARGTVNIAGKVGISSSSSQGVVLGDQGTLNVRSTGMIGTSSSESQAVLIEESATTATVLIEERGMIDAVGAQAIVDRGMTDTTVTVNGTVFGGSSDPVIDLMGGDDTVIVNGTVRGTSANPVVDMGAGNDTTTINSATTVEGPGVLVASGDGDDTLNLANGVMYRSDQFTGAETVNASNGTQYTVNNDQPMQTVNVMGQNSQASVAMGGQVMNLNSSMGGSSTVEMGGSATNTSTGNGGTTNVNDGGSVDRSTTEAGGTTNVNDGGQASNVRSNMGGTVNVNSGGEANLEAGEGGGGSINFRSGSSTNMMASASGSSQIDQRIAGVNFENGSTVNVANSTFFTASAAGDTITLSRAADAFGGRANGRNQTAVANALDNIGSTGNNDVVAGLVLTAEDRVGETFDRLSGELFASTAQGFANSARGYTDIMLRRTAAQTSSSDGAMEENLASDGGLRFWLGGFGRDLSIDSGDADRIGGLGYDTDAYGAALGVEFNVGSSVVAGISGGYSSGETRIAALGDKAETFSYFAGAYAGTSLGGLNLGLAFSYGNHDSDTRRTVFAADNTFGTNGTFDGETYSFSADASFDLVASDNVVVAPVAVFNAVRVEGDFAEAGSGVFDQNGSVGKWLIYGGGGAEVAGIFTTAGGNVIRPSLMVTYERAFENDLNVTTAFSGAPNEPFSITGFGGGRDRVRGSLGLEVMLGRGSMSFTGETIQADGLSGYGGSVKFAMPL